ncbi:hypothetical protein [Lysinibacillus capsici]|uniref:hypothetical protein n=1 Tax=Lysinibacillus capsici TaxID=2115968 RepID=UPI0028967322|nr:hypothetical protein [Lysinibacillus capsici]
MEHKSIQQPSNEEILRQQLELLAERSKNTTDDRLSQMTLAMIEIHKQLKNNHVF